MSERDDFMTSSKLIVQLLLAVLCGIGLMHAGFFGNEAALWVIALAVLLR